VVRGTIWLTFDPKRPNRVRDGCGNEICEGPSS
jgi:hypothetical protein